jgi:hypothetical protein
MVEVLVALAILVFGMTAILGLLTFGAALSRTALLRTLAAAASHAVVADLEETLFPPEKTKDLSTMALDPGESEAGAPVDVLDRPLSGMPDVVYSARAVQNPDRPGEYRVDVEMSWRSAGIRRATTFTTLLVRDPFGEGPGAWELPSEPGSPTVRLHPGFARIPPFSEQCWPPGLSRSAHTPRTRRLPWSCSTSATAASRGGRSRPTSPRASRSRASTTAASRASRGGCSIPSRRRSCGSSSATST